VFSVIAAVNVSNRLEGIFGGFLRKRRRFVLDMSAYAYQEGRFVRSYGAGGEEMTPSSQ